MKPPAVSVTPAGMIAVDNPPAALGHHHGRVSLVYVTQTEIDYDRRVHTVGKSVLVTPERVLFKVPNTLAAHEAVEMVREELVDPLAIGALPVIELTAASKPTVEIVGPQRRAARA